LNGYNFGSAQVAVSADNVTIENSTFTASTDYDSIAVYSGSVVAYCVVPGSPICRSCRVVEA